MLQASSEDCRDWYLLNSKICGIPVRKFMSSSPLVSTFPEQFAVVEASNLKDGGLLDRRQIFKDEVVMASSFGIVSAILRQKFKVGEDRKYGWLVDLINTLKIDQVQDLQGTATDDPDEQPPDEQPALQLADSFDSMSTGIQKDISKIEADNHKLQTDLEAALLQLKALREELNVQNGGQSKQEDEPESQKDAGDVWTLIGDVCDKYQVPLASVIADQVHSVEGAKLMSNIADQVMKKKEPKEALEAVMGENAQKFLQSLRVPDWTLLYFKLQSRIPDQGWQTLLNFTKLGRTKVSQFVLFFFLYCWLGYVMKLGSGAPF